MQFACCFTVVDAEPFIKQLFCVADVKFIFIGTDNVETTAVSTFQYKLLWQCIKINFAATVIYPQ